MMTMRCGSIGWRPALLGAAMVLGLTPKLAYAIPAWARRYNMNCTGCHYPVPPVLNADGLAFKWAGYRMPDQIGKNAEVTKIGDYLAARGIFQYAWTQTSGQPAGNNSFSVPSASVWAAGPLGKWFGGFLELEASPDQTIGVKARAAGNWGSENSFGGVEIWQAHLLSEGQVAGLDRAIGPNMPLPIDASIGAIPFVFADHTGMDVSWVWGKTDRLALGVANGMDPVNPGGVTRLRQDVFVSNQYIWDDNGGGLNLVGYYGSATAVDSAFLDATSHYYRVAVTANHWFGNFEATGGYVYGKDMDLPTGNAFTNSSLTGQAYWLGIGYTLKQTYLTFYGRWEVLDPNKGVSNDQTTRWVFGGVAPLMTPQNIRLGLEYFNDKLQLSGAPTSQGLFIELQLAY